MAFPRVIIRSDVVRFCPTQTFHWSGIYMFNTPILSSNSYPALSSRYFSIIQFTYIPPYTTSVNHCALQLIQWDALGKSPPGYRQQETVSVVLLALQQSLRPSMHVVTAERKNFALTGNNLQQNQKRAQHNRPAATTQKTEQNPQGETDELSAELDRKK